MRDAKVLLWANGDYYYDYFYFFSGALSQTGLVYLLHAKNLPL